jgi:hypothetical protein
MATDKSSDELASLLSTLTEGSFTDAQHQRLEQLLLADPAARRRYCEYTEVDVILQWRMTSPVVGATTAELAASEAQAKEPTSPTTDAGVLRDMVNVRQHPVQFGLFVMAATLLLFAGLFAWVLPWWREESAGLAKTAKAKVDSIAHITQVVNPVWREGAVQWRVGSRLVASRELSLVSGLVKVEFGDGATILLEGPCEFRVESQAVGRLKAGQLTANVPFKAAGFRVETDAVSIVDLGTEFGLQVAPEKQGFVRVFDGRVNVVRHAAKGSEVEVRMLVAGESLRFDVVNGQVAEDQSELPEPSFNRIAPKSDSLLPPDTEYSRRVLATRPIAYYRMERDLNGSNVLRDSLHPKRGGVIAHGARGPSAWAAGADGTAFDLRGPAHGDFAIVPDYPQPTTGAISVAAWVYAESCPTWASIAKDWGETRVGLFHLGLEGAYRQLSIHVIGSDGEYVRIGEESVFPTRSWQHVAFTVDDRQLRLYRNGDEVASAPCNGIALNIGSGALGIGAKLANDGRGPAGDAEGYWNGRLDELAIFDRGLSEREVGSLATLQGRDRRP